MIDREHAALNSEVMEIVAAEGGRLDSRSRLHELAFLLKHMGWMGFKDVRFAYNSRKPYSREISDVLHELIVSELVDETRQEQTGGDYQYSYQLTQRGEQWLAVYRWHQDERFSEIMRYLITQPPAALELSSIVKLLCYQGKAQTEEDAFRLVLDLRSDLLPCRKYAEEILAFISEQHEVAGKLSKPNSGPRPNLYSHGAGRL